MKRFWWTFCLFAIFTSCNGVSYTDNKNIEDFFSQNRVHGTFVLYDGKKFTVANRERAKRRITPASTFKVANSLIVLDSGVLHSVDEVFFHYDGTPLPRKEWEKDMNLREAIAVSNFVAYQQLARKVGKTQMQKEIKKIHYGNEQIGDAVDRFWVDGPLKISAIEQSEFLMNLAKEQLPFSTEIQQSVKDILHLEETPRAQLYGKTGLFDKPNETPVGWFVGFVYEKSTSKYLSFAFNMDMPDTSDDALQKRVDIVKSLLQGLYLL